MQISDDELLAYLDEQLPAERATWRKNCGRPQSYGNKGLCS
ncbi:MAG: hypothetical protein R3C02_04250 [Planctomycetaceae bacterium]